MVIDIRPGTWPYLLIFDPKYKLQSEFIARICSGTRRRARIADDDAEGATGRPKKVDIDKMHAYRDAIQLDRRRVVDFAAILYPGPAVSYGTEVAALPAYPTRADELDESLHTVIHSHLARAINAPCVDITNGVY